MIDERWLLAQRILAIRLDNLGDVLVTTPAMRAIKTSLPSCKLSLLTSPVGAQVARLNSDIDEVIIYEAPWMDPWQKLPQDSKREQEMIALIKKRRFDAAVIFSSYHQSPLPAAYLCYLADIPLRLAASIDGPGSLLTTRHKHPKRMMHEVERGLDLVHAVGFSTNILELVLKVPIKARENIYEFLSARNVDPLRPLLVIHPGCSMPARTYPSHLYSEVIDQVIERMDATVVVTGTNDEQALIEQVIANVREQNREAILACGGILPFPDFCSLIEAADLVITNNTGPMHIAAAVKTPVVALFALTNPPEQWGPWRVPHRQLYHEVPCRICYHRICPFNHECLSLVTPEVVVHAAEELLVGTIPGVIEGLAQSQSVSDLQQTDNDDEQVSALLLGKGLAQQTTIQVNNKRVLL